MRSAEKEPINPFLLVAAPCFSVAGWIWKNNFIESGTGRLAIHWDLEANLFHMD